MNECGVVNTDCYDPWESTYRGKEHERLGIIIIDIGLSRPTGVQV